MKRKIVFADFIFVNYGNQTLPTMSDDNRSKQPYRSSFPTYKERVEQERKEAGTYPDSDKVEPKIPPSHIVTINDDQKKKIITQGSSATGNFSRTSDWQQASQSKAKGQQASATSKADQQTQDNPNHLTGGDHIENDASDIEDEQEAVYNYEAPEPAVEPWNVNWDNGVDPIQDVRNEGQEKAYKFSYVPPRVPPRPPIGRSSFGRSMPNLPDDNWYVKHLGISKEQFNDLIQFRANYERRNKWKLFLTGIVFSPVTMLGMVIGYVRGHNRFERQKDMMPSLYPLSPVKRVSMSLGIVVAWLGCLVFALGIGFVFYHYVHYSYTWGKLFGLIAFNAFLSLLIYSGFSFWRRGVLKEAMAARKFGSARFARKEELFTLKNKRGYYIGQGHLFDDKGHILTVAGTRGGKGTNLIIPNLLGAGSMETSWVVIDPKGENAAVTADYQRSIGQNVVILNPWGLLAEYVGEAQTFNPLDMLPSIDDPNLVDDVQMLAEMIVPHKPGDHNSFFTDSARTIVSGLLMHLVTTETGQRRSLKTLWEWCRLESTEDETSPWDNLLAEMDLNETPGNGEIVRNARREILRMATTPETFGSIMSDVLLNTDFLKSPSLQKNLRSGFDPKVLAKGKTTVYLIIPADKLKTHARWLRLVTTSLMRAVIRKPNKRVTFLLDEFAALGHLSEIETALITYAGYNVTVWPILQTLGQLIHLYDKNWQTFIGNCTVRQYFSLNDNESAQYVAEAIGMTSNVSVSKKWFGVENADSNQRYLITPDELRRESGKNIFMFITDLPATIVRKMPYYLNSTLSKKARKNPYIN